MKLCALFTFLLMVLATNASANENLNFKPPSAYKENLVIKFVQNHLKNAPESYEIAKIDLNNDYIDEYIIRPKSIEFCNKSGLCPYSIIALHKLTPVSLGYFMAHNMTVSDKTSFGIRNLWIYNNPSNNFENVLTKWEPYTAQYQLAP